ncbi:hypothetical protein U1Q18_037724 [Sarracenia purpurea var. burkii]
MFTFTFSIGFLVGVLTVIAIEAVGVVLVIRRLYRRVKEEEAKAAAQSGRGVSDLEHSFIPSSFSNKQGVVWVLEPEKVPKSWLVDKVPREQKRKKEMFEVVPVRRYAKVKDQSLILTELDGSHREIQLKACTIAAVSATNLSSRKWAKKYPILVESKTSVLYNGSKTIYLYLETSWEKESWCKALRFASCNDKNKLKWFSKLYLDFQSYLTTINTGYPPFMKPSVGFNAEPLDRSVKVDGSSSKVRHFLKKFAKKASKSGVENKTSCTVTSGRDERKINEKCHSFQDSGLATGAINTAPVGEAPQFSAEDKMGLSSSTLSQSGSRSHTSVFSEADFDDRIGGDEGTLCWNLIISRLFFDAKHNTQMANFLQSKVQRALSNMRIPSYIGEITCTDIDLGNLPPYINGMRILPSDMNELWALEIDLQYSGSAVLHIETRVEVHELDFEEGVMDTTLESSSVGEVTSDLLEGFEYFGKQLELSEGADAATEKRDEADSKLDTMKSYKISNKASSSASRWKYILNSIAKQVSQVPLSLAIRVASLRGTLRLHIKPPPSDQLWFGFTSMPDVDFNLESSVGEHKINSGHIAFFLVNRFKAAIRETLVLPNCECVCIPWMLAEKDDWVPQNVAPFVRINQDGVTDPTIVRETPRSQTDEATLTTDTSKDTTSNFTEVAHEKGRKVEFFQQRNSESSGAHPSSSAPTIQSTWNSKSLRELSTPFLSNEETQVTCEEQKEQIPECQSMSRSLILTGEPMQVMEGDDMRPKRMGTKARMLGLGKKMGEKLEEKRRHIEEKGRHIVEKMKGP